jgi:hypothetical protein
MRLRTIIAILLMLATAACSTYRREFEREFDSNPSFAPHYYRSFDVEVTWQAERSGQEIRLSGFAINHRYAYLRDLELTARLLDDKGNTLVRETAADIPTYIPPEKESSFQMTLGLPQGAIPASLRFNYTYFLAEEPPAFRGYGGGYEDLPHFGKFEAPL